MYFGRLVRGSGLLGCLAGAFGACATPPRAGDSGVEDVRRLRDGTVMLPNFYDASDASAEAHADASADMQAPLDAMMPVDTGVEPMMDAAHDAGSDVVMDVPMAPTTTNVRFAYALPPGAPSQVDFCVRRTGSTELTGPLVRMARAGMGNGIELLQVTRYFTVPSGSIDVIAVAGSAEDCTTPILPPMVGLNVGAANGFRTVVLSGIPGPGPDGGPQPFPLAGRVLVDRNPSSIMPGQTALRVFNAIPSPTRLDIGIVTMPMGMAIDIVLFSAVGFGEVGGPMGGSYPDGYYPSMPLPIPVTVGMRANCGGMGCGPLTTITLPASPNPMTDRGLTSVFLALQARAADGGAPTPTPVAIFCSDLMPPIGANSACVVLPM